MVQAIHGADRSRCHRMRFRRVRRRSTRSRGPRSWPARSSTSRSSSTARRRHGRQGDDQRARCGAGVRQERDRATPTRRARPHRLLDPRRRPRAARHLRGDGLRRRQVADASSGRCSARRRGKRAQRHPVRRRRPVGGASHGRAHAVQGDGGGTLRRRAGHRRHAAHGARLHRRHRLDRHRFGQLDERLHDRPQVVRQRHGRLLRAQQERLGASPGRDHRRAGQAPQRRHGGRRRDQHRDRGRHAGGHGGARAAAQRLRRHRAHVLRGEARGDDGRRLGLLPAEVGRGRQAQGRGELPREVQGGRLPLRGHGHRDEGRRRRQGDARACSACSIPATSTARSTASVLKKGTVAKYPDQPDLADQTQAAIDILSQGPERVRADGGVRA